MGRQLWLPRFRLEESMGLSRLLKAMGMHDAFTGAADFGDIAPGGGLAIADVLHKGAWLAPPATQPHYYCTLTQTHTDTHTLTHHDAVARRCDRHIMTTTRS
jgi:hypothetical protein